ncbi:SMP-30/gluconolactonase/LRE family protein [Donghicola tyrosinivorans]|uniref:Sugar lactone lactonase YvrE n=1 Tax=Donghicola tyrosinivorans TaxID=1652492 RepID=A0A2T0WGJ9_9RHOB|nr:ATP/GTP-binding protein [Donghicola tyrosinivorans]PRY85816.1 sugar lactone lactonase YvrE [Donghicola tyrosinivorans]
MLRFFLMTAVAALPSVAAADPSASGFDRPESVVFDSARDRMIVSSLNGEFNAKDGNGYLSLLDGQGQLQQKSWITGLDAPKGMAISGDLLFVADVDALKVIDLSAGSLVQSYPGDGAVFLNDVTVVGDAVYVTDLLENAIWRLDGGVFAPWLKSDDLSNPNGIAFDGQQLLVGSWGKGLQADFTTKAPGDLLAVDLDSKKITVVAEAVGNIDGIALAQDSIFVSDWVKGTVIRITSEGPEVVAEFPAGVADIGTDGENLLLPHMMQGSVEVLPLP